MAPERKSLMEWRRKDTTARRSILRADQGERAWNILSARHHLRPKIENTQGNQVLGYIIEPHPAGCKYSMKNPRNKEMEQQPSEHKSPQRVVI